MASRRLAAAQNCVRTVAPRVEGMAPAAGRLNAGYAGVQSQWMN